MQHLDGDGAIVSQVLGEIDGRHPADADLAVDVLSASESRVELLGRAHPPNLHFRGGHRSPRRPRSRQRSTMTLNPPYAMRLASNGITFIIFRIRGSFMTLALTRLRCARDL